MEIEKELFEKITNAKRKSLLINMDKGNTVSDLELGMYDLSTYYDVNNMTDVNNSLSAKILLLQNEQRKINHILNDDLYFMPKQIEALNFISNNKNIILSAPTSFGKTLILKEYIYLWKPDAVVFIVPTNALAYELEQDFKKNLAFSDYSIFDKNKIIKDNDSTVFTKLLFIGTQEKYLEIKDSIPHIDLFVIDEAYKLQEPVSGQRSYKLSQAFLDSQIEKSEKVCLLSPNAKFEGFNKYFFQTFNTRFNAVDKQYHILEIDKFYNKLIEKSRSEKTILFCQSPNDFIQVEQSLQLNSDKHNNFIHLLENEFHPEWTVTKLLKKGVLSHNGLMPKYIQNKMINLFNNNYNYTLLVGTNSISEGINTPTKNMFININCSIQDKKFLLKNTIGRAGRLKKYPIGHIYSVDDSLEQLENEDINIKLAIDDEDNLKEILEGKDNEKVNILCELYNIEPEFCNLILKKYKVSLNRLKAILNVLTQNKPYQSITNLPFMGMSVFPNDYYNAKEDKFYIKGVLNNYYKDNDECKSLIGFANKIDFIKMHFPSLDIPHIVDNYMKFIYSTLDYIICPITNIAKEIYSKFPNWKFGDNVMESINEFNKKYYKTFFGVENFDIFSENQKNILLTLREYGINIKDCNLNKDVISEIENSLNIRYSTYDIINAITKLSESNSPYKKIYGFILDKYISI